MAAVLAVDCFLAMSTRQLKADEKQGNELVGPQLARSGAENDAMVRSPHTFVRQLLEYWPCFICAHHCLELLLQSLISKPQVVGLI